MQEIQKHQKTLKHVDHTKNSIEIFQKSLFLNFELF